MYRGNSVVLAGLGLVLALVCAAQLANPILSRVEDKASLDEKSGASRLSA